MQKRHYRFLLGLAVVGLLLSLTGPLTAQAAPNTYSDLKGHWAAGPINKWNEWGLVGGYSNGTFGVSRPVTRAEFIAFVNRAFGYTKTAEISFTDVKPNSWFAGDIAKAIGMGYMTGNADGTFRPNQPLSRLEAAQVLYKVMRLESITEDHLAQYRDLAALNGEDKAMLNAVVAKGYFGGYPDKTIRPQSTITRAEMIAILSRAAGEIMNSANTFGPETGTVTLPGNATISKSGTTLRNTIVNGDLYITEGVGEGDFFLKNVKVLGRAIVAGGGSNSGHVEGNSQLAHLIITYPDGSTHMVFADQASAEQVEFHSSGDIDTSGSTSEIRPTVTLSANIPPGSTVTAVGAFASVNVDAPGVTFAMAAGSVAENVVVNESATGTSVSIAGNVTGSVTVSAPQATATIASTATVATVTTTTTAASSAITVQGTVTTIAQNAPQATTTVVSGATVSTVVTAPTATGGTIAVQGTVSQIQASAPIALTVGTGGAVSNVTLDSGAAGSSVVTEQGATKPTVTAPPEVTWQNDGKDTSGSSTGGGTSGGSTGGDTGGGDPQPTTIVVSRVTLRDTANALIADVTPNQNNELIVNVPQTSQVISGFSLSTNVTGGNYRLNLSSLTWLGKTKNVTGRYIDVQNGDLAIKSLLGRAIDATFGTGNGTLLAAAAMGNDINLSTLRQFSGTQMRFVGTISASGYASSAPITLVVNVAGADDSNLVFDTQWARISVMRNTQIADVHLKVGNPAALVKEASLAGLFNADDLIGFFLDGLTSSEMSGTSLSPTGDAGTFVTPTAAQIKSWIVTHSGKADWDHVTMGDLNGFGLSVKLPTETVYGVLVMVP